MTKTTAGRRSIAAAAVLLVSACGADDRSADPAPAGTDAASPTTTAASPNDSPTEQASQSRSFVAFGDSWPYGAHCNGCTPFPDLYAEALDAESSTGFTNLTENGGTSDSLLQEIRTSQSYRDAITGADIIIFSIGANDMEAAMGSAAAGTCGAPDGIGCFRSVAHAWGANMDAMLAEIDTLRAGRATAVRVLSMSNEFLSDPGLIDALGPAFGPEQGARIVAWQEEEFCRAAASHQDVCIDLRPVLNGPRLDQPRDVNTQEAMQAVADSLVASGLPELASS